MRLSFIKKQLNSGINNINIPQKEQILPNATFKENTPLNKHHIYYKKIANTSVALLVVIAIALSIYNINFNSEAPISNEKRTVVSGDISDIPIGHNMVVTNGVESPYNDWNFTIHDKLKEKMSEYKNQYVWFRVLVRVDITDAPKYQISKQAQNEIDTILEQAEKVKNEMNSITWNLYTTPENIINERKEKLKSLSNELQKLYDKSSEIEQADRTNFQNEQIEKKLDIARNLGALNIVNAKESSDCSFKTTTYIMEVTANMINQLVDSGYFHFALAHPTRLDGYSDKISDSLTVNLSAIRDTDTIEIAVVTVADHDNSFAVAQKIPANPDYNNKYNKALTKPENYMGYTIDLIELINDYIYTIVNRNGLAEKRVPKETLPSLEPGIDVGEKEFYAVSGFNAVLTKAEILSLTNDPDVKVIFLAEQKNFISDDTICFNSELDVNYRSY